jgi:haloacetate dehalogenase
MKERRTVLGDLATATATEFSAFRTADIKTSSSTVFARISGEGPGLLLIHGFPRTSLMWRHLAPKGGHFFPE